MNIFMQLITQGNAFAIVHAETQKELGKWVREQKTIIIAYSVLKNVWLTL